VHPPKIVAGSLLALAGALATWAWVGRTTEPTPGDEARPADAPREAPDARPLDASILRGGAHSIDIRASRPLEARPSAVADADADARTLDVRVTNDARQPFAGLTVVAVLDDGSVDVVAVTDASGLATLTLPRRAGGSVFVRRGGRAMSSQPLPAAADGASLVPLYVRQQESVELRVTRRGVATLPPSFEVSIGGRPVLVRARLPEAGVVLGSVEPSADPGPAELTFSTPDLRPRTIPVVDDPAIDGIQMDVELEPAGPSLTIELGVPATVLGACGPCIVSRLDERTGTWAFARFVRPPITVDASGVARMRVDGLAAGSYRVLEGLGGSTSEPLVLAPRGVDAVARFAFPSAGFVRGRIDVGPDLAVEDAEVGLWDGTTTEGTPRARLGTGDGAFVVPIPGDRPVTLRATHPLGANAAPGLAVTLTEPRDGLVLRVVAGATADVELVVADDDPFPPRSVWVHLWDATRRKIAWASRALPAGRGFRFSGGPPGTYDVVLDDGVHAPIVLPAIALGSGPTDLGRHRLSYGSTIRIRVVVPDGMERPRGIAASATRMDDPRGLGVSRWAGDDRLRGLVPGRYQVRFHGTRGPLPPANGVSQTVEIVEGEEAVATLAVLATTPPK
jgi:hypothetical protein